MHRTDPIVVAQRDHDYDAIVVGARPAGAATAMLLARRGHRVLVVDRAQRGSDTISTHGLMKPAVLQLHRWGLLDQIVAAGTPAVRATTFHYGSEALRVETNPVAGVDALYAPRRTVLDPVLAGAAEDAGAELRFETAVSEILCDPSGRVTGIGGADAAGRPFRTSAPLVIGADGVRSRVARSVDAPVYVQGRFASAMRYAYFDGVDADGYEWYFTRGLAAGVLPTNDGAVVWLGEGDWRLGDTSERGARSSSESRFWGRVRGLLPDLYDRIEGATRTSRWHRFSGQSGYVRRSFGPGWALVGDAAHFKDPLSAHGLSDALRDAELLANAVDAALEDPSVATDALRAYQQARDEHTLAMFPTIDRLASYAWDEQEVQTLLLHVSTVMKAEVAMLLALDREVVAA